MGVDVKLFVNQKWNVSKLETLIRGLGYQITGADHKGDHSFVRVSYEGEHVAQLYVGISNEYGGLDGIIIAAGSRDKTIFMLRRMAKVIGGFYQDEAKGNDWEDFQDPHNGNARFVLDHVILRDQRTDGSKLSDLVGHAIGYEKKTKVPR